MPDPIFDSVSMITGSKPASDIVQDILDTLCFYTFKETDENFPVVEGSVDYIEEDTQDARNLL
jgi:hypothetical protein